MYSDLLTQAVKKEPETAAAAGDSSKPPMSKQQLQEHTAKQERAAAKKLLAEAPAMLQEIERSDLFRNGAREYPTFNEKEIQVGPVLGVGGSGIVYQVQAIHLLQGEKAPSITSRVAAKIASGGFAGGDDPHYDVAVARQYMSDHVLRDGDHARYAIKRLYLDQLSSPMERARGCLDLAIEAKFLSGFWHPNIVKMRGIAEGSCLSSTTFFIVMDRLYETLGERWEQTWKPEYQRLAPKKSFLSFGKKDTQQQAQLKELVEERLLVAYDLTSAFSYMHDLKLVYRDIKKENIGFDVRGDVKVFDFGLCKCLSPSLKTKDVSGRDAYKLTPRTGSVPFMAPEVVTCQPYDESCDVFSFAVLLWEMLQLEPAFAGYSRRDFWKRVAINKERPTIGRSWPSLTRTVIREGWDHAPGKRPNMKRIRTLLHGDVKDLAGGGDDIDERSNHLRERSMRSARMGRTAAAAKKAMNKEKSAKLWDTFEEVEEM